MGKKKDRHVFHVLGGPTYTQQQRPHFWDNETPLLYKGYHMGNPPDMRHLPLHLFPLIEDFQVILEEMRDDGGRALSGYHIHFMSPSHGYIASFPWWDHAEHELQREDFSIPLGDFAVPFSDVEQGWEIVIAEHDRHVYVLEGQFDQSTINGYHIWFKVPKSLYLSEWQKTIQACRHMRGG